MTRRGALKFAFYIGMFAVAMALDTVYPLTTTILWSLMVFALGASSPIILAVMFRLMPDRMKHLIGDFMVWTMWKFVGLRRVDMTALAGFVEDKHAYRAVPLALHVTRDGTPIVTNALLEITDEEREALAGEEWKTA